MLLSSHRELCHCCTSLASLVERVIRCTVFCCSKCHRTLSAALERSDSGGDGNGTRALKHGGGNNKGPRSVVWINKRNDATGEQTEEHHFIQVGQRLRNISVAIQLSLSSLINQCTWFTCQISAGFCSVAQFLDSVLLFLPTYLGSIPLGQLRSRLYVSHLSTLSVSFSTFKGQN